MLTLLVAGILTIAFLIGLWMLWSKLGGGAGPVIIITPPDPYNLGPVIWDLSIDSNSLKIEHPTGLDEKIPARLFGNVVEGYATLKDATKTVGFETITLEFAQAVVVISNDGKGKLTWEYKGQSPWRSSGGPVSQLPAILKEPVISVVFDDALGNSYGLDRIQTITLVLN